MKRFLFLGVIFFLALPLAAFGLPTTKVTIAGNLDAAAAIGAVPPATTFADLNAAAAFSTFFEVTDSLEAEHTITLYFFHVATNSWVAGAYVDGDVVGGTSGVPAQVGAFGTLFFNADGSLNDTFGSSIVTSIAWANGSTFTPFEIAFPGVTQLAAGSAISSIENSSDSSCDTISVCITQQYPESLAACASSATSCSRPLTDFTLVPGDLVTKAIEKAGCNRSFSSRSRCRSCYDKARRKLKTANSSGLFGQFIEDAMLTLRAQRDQTCR